MASANTYSQQSPHPYGGSGYPAQYNAGGGNYGDGAMSGVAGGGFGVRDPRLCYDPESGGADSYDPDCVWDNEKIRRTTEHDFIKKVYAILSAQLIVTFGVCAGVMSSESVKYFMLEHSTPILIVAVLLGLGLMTIILCNRRLLQRYPSNYIILTIFTLTEALIISYACITTATVVVLQAVLATSVLVLGLTLFAFQTKYDFTSWMGVMFYILLAFMTFGILKLLFFKSPIMEIVYASLGATLFSIYLVIDTQLLFSLSSDDYILAALTLYLTSLKRADVSRQRSGSRSSK